jgi:hypothetical protein
MCGQNEFLRFGSEVIEFRCGAMSLKAPRFRPDYGMRKHALPELIRSGIFWWRNSGAWLKVSSFTARRERERLDFNSRDRVCRRRFGLCNRAGSRYRCAIHPRRVRDKAGKRPPAPCSRAGSRYMFAPHNHCALAVIAQPKAIPPTKPAVKRTLVITRISEVLPVSLHQYITLTRAFCGARQSFKSLVVERASR